jgi:hypothetical protein
MSNQTRQITPQTNEKRHAEKYYTAVFPCISKNSQRNKTKTPLPTSIYTYNGSPTKHFYHLSYVFHSTALQQRQQPYEPLAASPRLRSCLCMVSVRSKTGTGEQLTFPQILTSIRLAAHLLLPRVQLGLLLGSASVGNLKTSGSDQDE